MTKSGDSAIESFGKVIKSNNIIISLPLYVIKSLPDVIKSCREAIKKPREVIKPKKIVIKSGDNMISLLWEVIN